MTVFERVYYLNILEAGRLNKEIYVLNACLCHDFMTVLNSKGTSKRCLLCALLVCLFSCCHMDEGSELRLGRYIDYPNLIRTFVKYEVGFPFVEDRIDRSRPLDRILYNGQWFMSGMRS